MYLMDPRVSVVLLTDFPQRILMGMAQRSMKRMYLMKSPSDCWFTDKISTAHLNGDGSTKHEKNVFDGIPE